MLKPILAGATAVLIAGSSLVYAQQRPATPGAEQGTTGAREQTPRRFSAEDAQAFTDARIAGLKAGLKLTPDQEKNWPAVESAIRDISKSRIDRMQARREARRDGDRQRDPIERMRQRADMMTQGAANLKKLADASEPLYKTLDEAQKRRLTVLTQQALRGGGGWRGHHGPRGEHRRM